MDPGDFSLVGRLLVLGTPALAPIGLGAWLYGALTQTKRRLLFIVALAIACTAGLALWCVLSFIHAPILRLQAYAGAFLCAATAASVAVGAAAAFQWARDAWLPRILALVAIVALTFAVGFQIATLAVWAAEL